MAASITGTFKIIDRASGTMKKMEQQAVKTMAAIEGVGAASDKAGSKSSSNARNLEKTERVMRNVARESSSTSKAMREVSSGMDRVGGSSGGLINKLGRLGTGFAGVRAIMMTMKFAGMAVAITSLVQAVGVLAGGLTALVPALSAASAAIVAFPTVIGAAVQGLVAFKAAFSGMGAALKAGTALQQNAGKSALQMADQQRQAAQAIQQAQRGIVMSARDVRNSEEALVIANRNSRDSVRDLTQARRDARRELTDMTLAQQRAALGSKGADLSLRAARERLSQMATDPQVTQIEMEQQRLAVQEAVLGKKEARIGSRRARVDNRRTQAKGINGNDRVVQAMRGMQDAQRGIRNATEGVSDALYGQKQAFVQLADAQRAANRLTREGSSEQQAYNTAMDQLPPIAQRFARRLIGLKGTLDSVKASAANGLIPGMDRSLTSVLRGVPMVKRVMNRTGRELGDNVASGAARLTTPSRLGDLEGIGNQQASVLGKMVRGTTNLSEAMIDLLRAAEPFTDWLTTTVEGWTKYVEVQSRAGRDTGRTAAFFMRSRAALERFGRILSNLFGTLRAVMKAATPLGERLWDGAERATAGWERYAKSVEGSAKIQGWFNKLYAPLHELGQLTKDLLQAWARITVAPGFTQSIKTLRTAVPAIESLMMSLSGLGPSAVGVLAQMADLFSKMPFSPIKLVLDALTNMLRVLNLMMDVIPGFGAALSALITVAMIAKIGSYATKVRLIGAAWDLVKNKARAAMAAQLAADAAGGPGLPGGKGKGGSRLSRLASKALRYGPLRLAGGAGIAAVGAYGLGAAMDALPHEQALVNHRDANGDVTREGRLMQQNRGGAAAVGVAPQRLTAPAASPVTAATLAQGSASNVERAMSRIRRALSGAMGAGNVSQIRAWSAEMTSLGNKAGGGTRTKVMALVKELHRAETVTRGWNLSGAIRQQFSLVLTSGGVGVSRLMKTLDRLKPGARRRVASQMKAMAAEMVAKGVLPARAADALVGRVDKHLHHLDAVGVRRGRAAARAVFKGLDSVFGTGFADAQNARLHPPKPKPLAIRGARGLKNFQEAHNLTADGLLGPRTSDALKKANMVYKSDEELAAAAARRKRKKVNDANAASRRETKRHAEGARADVKRATDGQKKDVFSMLAQTSREVHLKNEDMRANTAAKWRKAHAVVRDESRGAQTEATRAFAKMLASATTGLMAVGQTKAQAAATLKGGKGPVKFWARGGRVPGHGLRDTVQIAPGNIAAPGELVVNRHTEQRVAQKYGVNLGAEVAGESRPHHAAMHAKGGRVAGVTGALSSLIQRLDGMGFQHGSTTGGTHAANSYHYRGMAVDYGNASNDMARLWSVLQPQKRKFAEMFGPSGMNPKPTLMHYGQGFENAGLQSQHNDHIHVALAGGTAGALGSGGSPAGAVAKIKRMLTKYKGAPGGISQGVMDAYRRGLQKSVGGAGGTGDLGAGISGDNQKMGRAMMMRMGFPSSQWPALKALWTGESNWNEGARNPSSGAYGIPQALPASKMGPAAQGTGSAAAKAQIAWGLRYIKDRYGSPSSAYSTWQSRSPHWYEQGGRVPEWGGWNAQGGTFDVRRPTVFGAGESGPERVQITPKGKGGGGAQISVRIDHIDYRGEGDIRDAVRRELELVAQDLEGM